MHASWIIEKAFDPNRHPAYRETLGDLPGYSEAKVDARGEKIVVRADMTPEQAEEVARRPHVNAVEPDYTARAPEPVRPEAVEQLDPGEIAELIGAPAAWRSGHKGRGRLVAVIDTGIGSQTRDELSGRLDYIEGVVDGEGPVNPADSHGDWVVHAIAHLAPDARFVILKGLSYAEGSGSYSGIIACIRRARELGCTEVNLSLGGPASTVMDGAVNDADAAGVIVAAAAGNEQEGSDAYLADLASPARAAGALTIAAAQSDKVIAPFSNHGVCLDASAPGFAVKAPNVDGYWSGTSMATPVFLAACALLASSGLSKSETKQAILAKCQDTAEPPVEEGQGFVDLAAAFPEPIGPIKQTPVSWYYIRKGWREECIVTYRGKPVAHSKPLG